MANKVRTPKKGNTLLQVEISNYLNNQIHEILSTGDFLNTDDFMMSAVASFIAQYETRRKKKPYENIIRRLLSAAEAEDNKNLADFLRPYLEPETKEETDQEDSKDNEWCKFLDQDELEKYL